MGYGDDIISSDNFDADDDDEFESVEYDSELNTDEDIDWEENDELADR